MLGAVAAVQGVAGRRSSEVQAAPVLQPLLVQRVPSLLCRLLFSFTIRCLVLPERVLNHFPAGGGGGGQDRLWW